MLPELQRACCQSFSANTCRGCAGPRIAESFSALALVGTPRLLFPNVGEWLSDFLGLLTPSFSFLSSPPPLCYTPLLHLSAPPLFCTPPVLFRVSPLWRLLYFYSSLNLRPTVLSRASPSSTYSTSIAVLSVCIFPIDIFFLRFGFPKQGNLVIFLFWDSLVPWGQRAGGPLGIQCTHEPASLRQLR